MSLIHPPDLQLPLTNPENYRTLIVASIQVLGRSAATGINDLFLRFFSTLTVTVTLRQRVFFQLKILKKWFRVVG